MAHAWIHKLTESNSKLHKLAVIEQALAAANLGSQDADMFLQMAGAAYNTFEVYNFKRVKVIEGLTGKNNDFHVFKQLLHDLKTSAVTGKAAEAEVEQVASQFDTEVWKTLCRPVILKDLRVGATINSFNKVLKGTKYEIPEFTCQLATDSVKHPKKLIGKKILEPKLDGVRMLAVIDSTFKLNQGHPVVTLYSRSGKLMDNFPHINEQLASIGLGLMPASNDKLWYGKIVLDGEIISENFQALMKQARRKTNVDTSDSVYSIFDVIPYKDFIAGEYKLPQEDRSKILDTMRSTIDTCSSLVAITGFVVDLDTKAGHETMKQYGLDQVDLGYEGIMIKDPKAPYLCKRRTYWMKWKPTITVDLIVTGFEEGTGKNKGKLGAMICEGTDDGRDIVVACGGGYTDKQRTEFWANRKQIKGDVVEVKADAVTQNESGVYSLRFPRFVRFRGISKGEKM